jgi:hypothetical protein
MFILVIYMLAFLETDIISVSLLRMTSNSLASCRLNVRLLWVAVSRRSDDNTNTDISKNRYMEQLICVTQVINKLTI